MADIVLYDILTSPPVGGLDPSITWDWKVTGSPAILGGGPFQISINGGGFVLKQDGDYLLLAGSNTQAEDLTANLSHISNPCGSYEFSLVSNINPLCGTGDAVVATLVMAEAEIANTEAKCDTWVTIEHPSNSTPAQGVNVTPADATIIQLNVGMNVQSDCVLPGLPYKNTHVTAISASVARTGFTGTYSSLNAGTKPDRLYLATTAGPITLDLSGCVDFATAGSPVAFGAAVTAEILSELAPYVGNYNWIGANFTQPIPGGAGYSFTYDFSMGAKHTPTGLWVGVEHLAVIKTWMTFDMDGLGTLENVSFTTGGIPTGISTLTETLDCGGPLEGRYIATADPYQNGINYNNLNHTPIMPLQILSEDTGSCDVATLTANFCPGCDTLVYDWAGPSGYANTEQEITVVINPGDTYTLNVTCVEEGITCSDSITL